MSTTLMPSRGAVAGAHAVISTLGVPFTKQPVDVYSDGMANIIAPCTGRASNDSLP